MYYTDTFVLVAPDCPVQAGEVPVVTARGETVASIQYDLLSKQPYHFTQDELYFAVHVRHKGVPAQEAKKNRQAIWDKLFAKPQACLRTSPLPKRYGWGVHYDKAGRIALWSMNSKEYAQFANGKKAGTKLVYAMRSQRA